MLHIDRMSIRLPPGFAQRASAITQLVADALADYQAREDIRLDSLTVGPVQVASDASDQSIAQEIAQQIISSLGEHV